MKNNLKKKWLGLYGWFSICSAHGGGYELNCPACNTGTWVFIPRYYIIHFLIKLKKWK